MTPTINSDAILVRLGYSSKTGETATFKIEQSAWEKLKANEGKNYVLVLAEIGDDGQPTVSAPMAEKVKGWQCGERAKWVIERCKEPNFWRFLSSEAKLDKIGLCVDNEDAAKAFVLGMYGMQSRKEFDERQNDFDQLREHYKDWLLTNA